MAEEKIVTINLRKDIVKARRVKKASIAISVLRKKIEKMFKGMEVKIGKSVNEEIWKKGAKKPIGKIKVKLIKDEKIVRVELVK